MRASEFTFNLTCNFCNIRLVMVPFKADLNQLSNRKEVNNNPANHSGRHHGGCFRSGELRNAAPTYVLEDTPILVGNESIWMITNFAFAKGMQGTRYKGVQRRKPANDEDG